MGHPYKPTTITLSGYQYQNLVGLKLLLDWMDNPSDYNWVEFEADLDVDAKGLDDIVAQREDGKYLYWQVKFCVEPDRDDLSLSWKWLTDHTKMGKSLVQKWFNAINNLGEERLGEVALITNRKPDRDLYNSIKEGYIAVKKIDREMLEILEEQLGSLDNVNALFDVLKISHSYQGYESLESSLKDGYLKRHTNYNGWNRLLNEMVDWARYKKIPQPDGRITLTVLRQLLSEQRPAPLPEDFRIPKGYMPPDDSFHEDFINKIKDIEKQIIVLDGSPGRGKSTYLSYVCDCLYEENIPYIRHHYFLSLDDHSLDRVSLHSVGNTLITQMEKQYRNELPTINTSAESLNDWIEECGKKHKKDSVPFIVIIDGLDHVWRENAGDKTGMDALFRKLLPVPDNVILILGTQPVSQEQLPTLLPDYSSNTDWITLPTMSLSAIRHWISEQCNVGRFEVPEYERDQEQYLDLITKAFKTKTQGHPLHLIYSLEALVNQGGIITDTSISELPDCPDGDIRIYYRRLWANLSFTAKDILHLVSSMGYFWPKDGLVNCIGDEEDTAIALYEVLHLLYSTEAGLKPFHGSILAYVRETEEHSNRELQLQPKVIDWLKDNSPEFYRWGWLWLTEARAGNYENLLNDTSRKWAVESFCKAYPSEQIIKILAKAEEVAYESGSYARAVELRWLKTSMLNGPEFQVDDYELLVNCAVRLADDSYPLHLMSANMEEISDKELTTLGQISYYLDDLNKTEKCIDELKSRINQDIKYGRLSRREIQPAIENLFDLLAITRNYSPEKTLRNIKALGDPPEELFEYFVSRLSLNNDLELLINLWDLKLTPYMRQTLEVECVRVACIEKANLIGWSQFRKFSYHPITGCYSYIYSPKDYETCAVDLSVTGYDKEHYEYGDNGVEILFHQFFFQSLSISLAEENNFSFTTTVLFKNQKYYNKCLELLQEAAKNIANVIRSGSYPSYGFLYRRFRNELNNPSGYDEHRNFNTFRRSLLLIAQDLAVLTYPKRSDEIITKEEFDYAKKSRLFIMEVWQDRYMKGEKSLLSTDAISDYLDSKKNTLSKRVTPFNERASDYIELCTISLAHNLNDRAKVFLESAFYCVLGYGWRKDMTIFYVLNAIETCHAANILNSKERLKNIIPIIEHIGDFTDGDETRHARTELSELILKIDSTLFPYYLDHLCKQQEWYYVDKVLATYLESVDLSKDVNIAICSSIFESESTNLLRKKAEAGNEIEKVLFQNQAQFLGVEEKMFGKEHYSSTSTSNKDCAVNPDVYPPEILNKYLEDIEKCSPYEDEALGVWLDFWVEKGRESDAFVEIVEILSDDKKITKYDRTLDKVFDSSLKLEGKNKAYKWLVKAHIQGMGWGPWDSSEVSIKRLRKVATHYKDKWREFIKDSSISRYIHSSKIENLVIPSDRLVTFLTMVEKNDLAEELTNSMIRTTQEEMADQPIKTPGWINYKDDGIDIAIKVLFTRLRSPVNAIKWWTAHEISKLLNQKESSEKIWAYILNRLRECRYETEVLELLSILFLSRESNIVDVAELKRSILLPSILSDFMISKISGESSLIPSWYVSYVVEAPHFHSPSEHFEKVQGHQVPPILKNIMKSIEKKTGYPIIKQWSFDWENLDSKSEAIYSDLQYYTKHDNSLKETGQFVTEESHRGRSSYLRTLAFAVNHWDMPEREALDVAKLCMPIDFCMVEIYPQLKPTYLNFNEELLINLNNIDQIAKQLLESVNACDSFKNVLHYDGLIKDYKNEKVELEILGVFHSPKDVLDVENIFSKLSRMSSVTPTQNTEQNSLIIPSSIEAKVLHDSCFEDGLTPSVNPYSPLHLGHWHSDLWSRMMPILNNISDLFSITTEIEEGVLYFKCNDEHISKVSYWNHNWSPMHPRELKTGCTLMLTATEEYVESQKKINESNLTYIWKAKVLSREKEYGDFSVSKKYGLVTI